ncbi:carbamoyltransferase HypF [Acidithiobacillus sp.]
MLPVGSPSVAEVVRYRLRVLGQVQGVGFRPFAYRLATELGLGGWVRNDGRGVDMEVQGTVPDLERLIRDLRLKAPPLARVEGIEVREMAPHPACTNFLIEKSRAGMVRTGVPPDAAVCDACLEELFDPAERRYRYPFINCTHCGPRYTIIGALPYDRPNTAMAGFGLCLQCRREYGEPLDRRFHAEPVACPVCGPQLTLHDRDGQALAVPDVISAALALIRAGQILAVKGLGGFHLVCDARRPESVARLRTAKNRSEKPFALMAANWASLAPWVRCDAGDRALLESVARPIVLLPREPDGGDPFPDVAPELAWLGVMLPYTPIHYLLFHEAAGQPRGTAWLRQPQELVLVCTSANVGGEPLVVDNDEAFRRLRRLADAYVVHDRDILVRCDDSVLRSNRGAPVFIRRARGYAPASIKLSAGGPSVLALGGSLKNTICLTRGDEAFISQHLGDLDNAAACTALEETVAHLLKVLGIRPERVAHDLHPDFHSSRFALAFAAAHGLPAVAVQHHHAHVAAVMAEHGLQGPCLGLALDGVGMGSDGTPWGGELLRVEEGGFQRLGHLRSLALPGGDRAAREPWRMAASALHALGRGSEIIHRFPHEGAEVVARMLERGINAPFTSSAGRLFDAAAGLLGIKDYASFEGQAAILLESLALRRGRVAPLVGGYGLEKGGILDLLPLLDHLADLDDAAFGAALFHATLARGLVEWAAQASARSGVRRVALGGGCFVNEILRTAVRKGLEEAGLEVFEARQLPPNDGGLSLGQAWVAQAVLLQKE